MRQLRPGRPVCDGGKEDDADSAVAGPALAGGALSAACARLESLSWCWRCGRERWCVQSGPGPQLRVSHVYDSPMCLDEGNLCGDPALLRQTHAGLGRREGVSSGWIEGCEIGAKLTQALLACKDTLTYLRLNMSGCCARDAVVHGRCKLLMAALAWRRLSRRHGIASQQSIARF